MAKRCNNSELLIRIDERMQHLHDEDIPEIKGDIKELKNRQDTIREEQVEQRVDIKILKKDVNKSVGFKVTRFLNLILGK